MKICVVQNRPLLGDIERNISNHVALIMLSIEHSPDIIVFPELSITGYDYHTALTLATDLHDNRFAVFQKLSDLYSVIIGIGVPIKDGLNTCISIILFHPNKSRHLYSKKYLHPDEDTYFSPGKTTVGLIGQYSNVALAICHEISVLSHVKNVNNCGAKFYVACVAKFDTGIDRALIRLSDIANEFSMIVLMANSVGKCGENVCAGRSSIWNNNGLLLGQLDNTKEGGLIIDTDTKKVITFCL